jgi:hypothetical protein
MRLSDAQVREDEKKRIRSGDMLCLCRKETPPEEPHTDGGEHDDGSVVALARDGVDRVGNMVLSTAGTVRRRAGAMATAATANLGL